MWPYLIDLWRSFSYTLGSFPPSPCPLSRARLKLRSRGQHMICKRRAKTRRPGQVAPDERKEENQSEFHETRLETHLEIHKRFDSQKCAKVRERGGNWASDTTIFQGKEFADEQPWDWRDSCRKFKNLVNTCRSRKKSESTNLARKQLWRSRRKATESSRCYRPRRCSHHNEHTIRSWLKRAT